MSEQIGNVHLKGVANLYATPSPSLSVRLAAGSFLFAQGLIEEQFGEVGFHSTSSAQFDWSSVRARVHFGVLSNLGAKGFVPESYGSVRLHAASRVALRGIVDKIAEVRFDSRSNALLDGKATWVGEVGISATSESTFAGRANPAGELRLKARGRFVANATGVLSTTFQIRVRSGFVALGRKSITLQAHLKTKSTFRPKGIVEKTAHLPIRGSSSAFFWGMSNKFGRVAFRSKSTLRAGSLPPGVLFRGELGLFAKPEQKGDIRAGIFLRTDSHLFLLPSVPGYKHEASASFRGVSRFIPGRVARGSVSFVARSRISLNPPEFILRLQDGDLFVPRGVLVVGDFEWEDDFEEGDFHQVEHSSRGLTLAKLQG